MCACIYFLCAIWRITASDVFFSQVTYASVRSLLKKITSSLFFIQISHKKFRHAKSAVAHKKYKNTILKNKKIVSV